MRYTLISDGHQKMCLQKEPDAALSIFPPSLFCLAARKSSISLFLVVLLPGTRWPQQVQTLNPKP